MASLVGCASFFFPFISDANLSQWYLQEDRGDGVLRGRNTEEGKKKLSDQFPTTQPPVPHFLHYLWLLATEILN